MSLCPACDLYDGVKCPTHAVEKVINDRIAALEATVAMMAEALRPFIEKANPLIADYERGKAALSDPTAQRAIKLDEARDKVEAHSQFIVDDAYYTEDGQTMVVDPARIYQLKDALSDLAEVERESDES